MLVDLAGAAGTRQICRLVASLSGSMCRPIEKVRHQGSAIRGTDVGTDAISHRAIATLPLVPHAHQRRVAGVDEVDDPHIGLVRMPPVQAPCVLLQCAPPGNRHGQHQGVQRRMVEAFADQLSGGQQD